MSLRGLGVILQTATSIPYVPAVAIATMVAMDTRFNETCWLRNFPKLLAVMVMRYAVLIVRANAILRLSISR